MPRPLSPEVLAATGGDPDAVRELILAAARRVIQAKGLAAASTRAIAEEAGVSGGTLYSYFDGRVDLVAKAIMAYARELIGGVADLTTRAGRATVADNLLLFTRRAARVLGELVPLLAASFSDTELLAAIRTELARAGSVNDPAAIVELYLVAERSLGNIRPDADCRAAAALVVSMCHADAFARYLHGSRTGSRSRRLEIALIARSLTGTSV
jgi:AcrR family transcriptional regulator